MGAGSCRVGAFASATPGTASAAVGITGLAAGESILGIDLRPATGAIYGLGSGGNLYTLNASTGSATFVSLLTPDASDLTNSLYAKLPPNDGTLVVIGALGVNTTGKCGLRHQRGHGAAFASLVNPNGSSNLYSIIARAVPQA